MLIKRDAYVEKLADKMHNTMIKVITGMRRSGKSYLLFNLFYNYLLDKGIPEKRIIRIALDAPSNARLRTPFALSDYINKQIAATRSKKMHYVFIDEIQLVHKVENPHVKGDIITFYEVLNGLLHRDNVDVYVTGSNSKMLSTDIWTEFRGRGDQIYVRPLSFAEFMSVYKGDKRDGWQQYILYGGMPYVMTLKKDEQKVNYLKNLFSETYVKDILARNNFKNEEFLEEMLNILSSSVGSLTNPNKLANTFHSVKKLSISQATLKNYLDALSDSFIIEQAVRYDIKGNKYIGSPYKYFWTDMGLRNARLNFRQHEENHIMENVIYNELKSRGYNVDVGVVELNEKLKNKKYEKKQVEIDFVANLGSKRYYIQSAFYMPEREKIDQEERPLLAVKDVFKKIIIVKDSFSTHRSNSGIITMNIYDFLLNADSLEWDEVA